MNNHILKERHFGIDMLRILAMIMIVLVHTLGHGGLLDNVKIGTGEYAVSWLLEVTAFCAVNLYGLISGFVGIHSNFKYKSLIKFWLQVFFYSILITLLFYIFCPETVTGEVVVNSLFPIIRTQYWYISSYFGMAFFLPYINSALSRCPKPIALKLFLTILVVYVTIPCLFGHSDPFSFNYGFSTIWLTLLYIMGALISKYRLYESFSKTKLIIATVCMVLLTWGSKLGIALLTYRFFGKEFGSQLLVLYVSPTVLINSICLLLLFAKFNINSDTVKKGIKILSPATLGVYLISDNILIRQNLLKGITANLACYNIFILCFRILVIVVSVYVMCSLIDIIRGKIYQLFRVEKIVDIIYNRIQNSCSWILFFMDSKLSN